MNSEPFEHLRHKPPVELERPRELVIACAPLRSQVNLARIMRAAGCMGIERVVASGNAKVDRKIARDAADSIELSVHRSLPPVLANWKANGYRLVGLEQTTGSQSLFEFQFERKTMLVVGNERQGLTEDVLKLLDSVVEIPVYGMPYSLNAATAASMAIYEYCRQFPNG